MTKPDYQSVVRALEEIINATPTVRGLDGHKIAQEVLPLARELVEKAEAFDYLNSQARIKYQPLYGHVIHFLSIGEKDKGYPAIIKKMIGEKHE